MNKQAIIDQRFMAAAIRVARHHEGLTGAAGSRGHDHSLDAHLQVHGVGVHGRTGLFFSSYEYAIFSVRSYG